MIQKFGELSSIRTVTVDLHGDITEQDILKEMSKVKEILGQPRMTELLLFFDEINTAETTELIQELICDRTCRGEPIDPRIKILAACNPLRKTKLPHSFALTPTSMKHRDSQQLVAYRVRELPLTSQRYLWDLDSISAEDERNYIAKMAAKSKLFEQPSWSGKVPWIVQLIFHSHQYLRQEGQDITPVSLRDVERCLLLLEWFADCCEIPTSPFEFPELSSVEVAIVLSFSVCYVSRCLDRQRYVDTVFGQKDNLHSNFLNCLGQCQRQLLRCFTLASDIFPTAPLWENVFLIFVCVQTRIPLMIIGKPGTCKSLSLEISLSQMRGNRSGHPFLRHEKFRRIQSFTLQCSTNTSAQIVKDCFQQANDLQKSTNNNIQSVVVLDEIGLAELNPQQPLKVLHRLLEDKENATGFIGVSNWILDPAKMNRSVCFFLLPHVTDLRVERHA